MKKTYFIIIAVVVAILVASIIYFVIYFKNTGKEEDLTDKIVASENKNKEKNYIKLEELPKEYSEEQAISDKCFVVSLNETHNKEVLDTFINNVNNKKSDTIRIIQFTVEGDMIISDFEYLENDTMNHAEDVTRDKFSSEGGRKIIRKQYNMLEYKIVEEEYQNWKIVSLEHIEKGYESQIRICGYHLEFIYNDSFELIYERHKNLGIEKIIETGEIAEYNYDIYSFGGEVKVKIDGTTITLKEALLQEKISMDDIMHNCVSDDIDGKIETSMYKDGGTIIYKYEDYWIIKCYTLDNNRDVYIGMPGMNFTGDSVELK